MKMKKLFVFFLTVSLLSGCAALGTVNQVFTSAKNPIVQAGVDLAVSAAVGTGSDAKQRATDIKNVATAILADASTPAATVQLLEAAVNAKVNSLAKNPGEAAAFMILTATLEGYLNNYIQTNPGGALTAQTLVDIQGLCKAVLQAVSFYGA